MKEMTLLYRAVGQNELELIRESKFTEFPPRFPKQPIFYTVLTEEYAEKIARFWAENHNRHKVGYVTRFCVRTEYLARYEVQIGISMHREYWIPAEDLAEFNRNIVGAIEVIAEYRNEEEQ
jgi:hypothetical protein